MYGIFAGHSLQAPMVDICFFGYINDPATEFNPDSYLGIKLPPPFNNEIRWVALYKYQDGSLTTFGDASLSQEGLKATIWYGITRKDNFAASSALEGIILPRCPTTCESINDVIAKYKVT